MPSLLDKVKGKLGIKKQPRGHKLGGDDYACQQREGEKPKQKRQLSDQEKEARRDAMAAAAANREKAWEKKISKSAHARRQEEKRKEREIENNFTEEEAVKSEATLRSVEEAKRSEQQLANVCIFVQRLIVCSFVLTSTLIYVSQAMGYNPYQPVMSSTMKGGVGGTTAKSENLTPPGPLVRNSSDSSATSKHSHAGFDEDVKVQLATALEYLLNQSLNGVCDGTISQIQTVFPNPDDAALFESGKLCINTVVKMLTNVASNPGEPKFR